MKFSFLLLGAAATGSLAAPAPHYELHERRDVIPTSWRQGKRLDGSTLLPVRVGLTQSNIDHGHDLLIEMSDPSSSRYGKHLSESQVHDLFAPSQESVDGVRSWLESSGVAPNRISQSTNKQWIQFDAAADELEKLLEAEYYLYTHTETARDHVACREYHVPRSLRGVVDYITPGIALREVTSVSRASGGRAGVQKRMNGIPPILKPIGDAIEGLLDQSCALFITPECIKTMYNVTSSKSATKGNELGVFEGINDVYSQEDLDLFFSTLAHEIPKGTHPVLKAVDGAKAPYPANYTFSGFLNTFLDAIDGSYCSEISDLDPPYPNSQKGGYKGSLQCGVYKPPNVISISYGSAEADLPISYQRRQCNEFLKLGMRGVSVVVASGDSGVAGRQGDPTPSNCLGKDGKVFAPDFPASCPYLTAVGGTYIPLGAGAGDHKEEAITSFPSGGGFSNIYKRPDWQSKAVSDYFAKAKPSYPYYESVNNNSFGANGGIYNRIGRGYPDVSAIGDNVVIFTGGLPNKIGGTSAAAPVFAALLTRINEERLAANKPTVGYVNPVLYKHPEAFYDVTKGSNPGCNTDGFAAAEGWDPVTGLGTPSYPELLKVFMDEK